MRAGEVPTLFTNGSVLGMMLPTDFSKAKSVDAEYQCLMLDCWTGQYLNVDDDAIKSTLVMKKLSPGALAVKGFQRKMMRGTFCFDGANNLIWGVRYDGEVLLEYNNPGRKVRVQDENPFVCDNDTKQFGVGEGPGCVTASYRVLEFLSDCASNMNDEDGTDAADPQSQTVPFLVKALSQDELSQLSEDEKVTVLSLPGKIIHQAAASEFWQAITWEAHALALSTTSLAGLNLRQQLEQALALIDQCKKDVISTSGVAIVATWMRQLQRNVQSASVSELTSEEVTLSFEKLFATVIELELSRIRSVSQPAAGLPSSKLNDSGVRPNIVALQNSIVQSIFAHASSSSVAFDAAVSVFKKLCHCVEAIASQALTVCQESREDLESLEKELRCGGLLPMASMVFSCALLMLGEGDVENSGSQRAAHQHLFSIVKKDSSELVQCLQPLEQLATMYSASREARVEETTMSVTKAVVVESTHHYDNDMNVRTELRIPGAKKITITFDSRCRTEHDYDYVTFYKSKSGDDYYGVQKYSGRDDNFNWPGVGSNPPLVIETDQVFVGFRSDSSNTDWGYRFTAVGELPEKKVVVRKFWLCALADLARSVVDEIPRQLIDATVFVPIDANEAQNDENLQIADPDEQDVSVLKLLRDFIQPSPDSDAAKVVLALQKKRSVPRFQNAFA
ncbi:hypothetical protein Poli38472_005982 [Pythium oligandrum]|uniref:Uncharacterized protein n=1 Tax=Pythium oligandrum TaxID=41045 RepID=A0A8K1CS12_PYTOL|nr:hypothetical protein Poli38472_005982 [Pythium oligandrum]|eukprot:TMW68514.1 hypothetical protein Poli38472_005982 [Pythium oligandrum]